MKEAELGSEYPAFDHPRLEPFANQANDPLVGNPVFEKPQHPPVIDLIEGNHDRLPIISTFPSS